jgi:ribose transport system permease protein
MTSATSTERPETLPPAFETDDAPSRRLRFVSGEEFSILIATVAIVIGASIVADGFLSTANLLSIAQQIALLGIVATGMTYVIVVGEIDLSVGSQYGFLAVALAWLVHDVGIPVGPAVPLVICIGAVIGAVNGLVTTLFGVPSFVVTLASLAMLRGGALLLSDGVPIPGSTNASFKAVTSGQPLPNLTAQSLWMALVMVTLGFLLTKTRFGSNVYSVGGNAKAAGDAGINVRRTKVTCFAITGALCGLAATLLVGWLGNANPLTGSGFELSVIAAVVVGGASLSGGKGSVIGTLLGAIIAGVLTNALVLAGIDGNWQQVATGALILVAVLVNVAVSRRARGSRHP